jgi:hypothetical protein
MSGHDLHDLALDSAILQGLLDADGGRDTDGGDEVVTAGVANAGEGIVFRVERHGAALAVGELGLEGGAEVVCAASDGETLLLEVVGEDLVGVDLFIADLGVLPDLEPMSDGVLSRILCMLTSRLIVFKPSFCLSMTANTESARPSAHEVFTPRANASRPRKTLRETAIVAGLSKLVTNTNVWNPCRYLHSLAFYIGRACVLAERLLRCRITMSSSGGVSPSKRGRHFHRDGVGRDKHL